MANLPVESVSLFLQECARNFADGCISNSTNPLDSVRRADLHFGKGGLQEDEATAFWRAVETGIVDVDADGRFEIRGARSCSPNLHLVGRNGEAVAVHMEYLIHIGACAELILDHGWNPQDLSFECGQLDIWGHGFSNEVILGVEAKARVLGGDSLEALARTFELRCERVDSPAPGNHDRKWHEVVRLTESRPILLWLVADGARWLLKASQVHGSLSVNRLHGSPDRSIAERLSSAKSPPEGGLDR